MKAIFKVLALSAIVLSLAACSKSRPEQMAMVDNVKINCTPSVLAVRGNEIPAEVTVTYPKDYFHPQAIMVVTPVLVYEGGQQMGPSFTYQGEDIKDNNRVVPSKGGTVSQKMSFTFVEGMEKSHLELRSVAFCGTKRIEIPAIKVADGCNVTNRLADIKGTYSYKKDNYQDVILEKAEGQILYDVNSSNVKNSELRSKSIRSMQDALADAASSDRYTVKGTQIVAYASPEGGEELNAKLSDDRASSARKAWKSVSNGMEATDLEIKSIGQDWEGFQEAITNSNIEDKELILRVLSMYSDPEVREREIRNMSQIYTEINKKVFPELRRARFITDIEYQNWTEEELEELSHKALGALDEEGILRVAANTDDFGRKAVLYQLASDKFDSERARFNLATMALDEQKPGVAEVYLDKIDSKDPDVINARGVVELQRGHLEEAVKYFEQAGTDDAKANIATIDILNGDYAEAADFFAGKDNTNTALALLLAGHYDDAAKALKGDDARSDYLRAIIAARQCNNDLVHAYLDSACQKDPSLKEYAAKDVEFAHYR